MQRSETADNWEPRVSEFFSDIHALKAGCFVARGDFAFVQTDDGETFREAHVRAVPPVAADGAAGDEFCVFVFDGFVDVEVALEDGDEVVAFERFQYLLARWLR